MRLESLKHIARSVQAMMEAERIIVFGSASLLVSFPELAELPESPLQSTYDADLIPYPFEESIGRMLDVAVLRSRIDEIKLTDAKLAQCHAFLDGVVKESQSG